jgi:hypothetical protein
MKTLGNLFSRLALTNSSEQKPCGNHSVEVSSSELVKKISWKLLQQRVSRDSRIDNLTEVVSQVSATQC